MGHRAKWDLLHGAFPRGRREMLLSLAALLAAPVFATLASAQEAIPGARDFSGVTTKRAARKLVREGSLVEISLFPLELGGPDDPMNESWITPEAAFVRDMVIGTLSRFVEDGVIDHLQVLPDYKGDSIVPSRIAMNASRSGEAGSFNTVIDVW